MIDYESIKRIAKKSKISVKDLLVLSPHNDPFYAGAPAQKEKAKWFTKLYELMGNPHRCHIRRVHYWLVTTRALAKLDGSQYQNTDKDWEILVASAKYARYLGLVPIENIIDRRNPSPTVFATHQPHRTAAETVSEVSPESIIEQIVDQFHCINPCKTQPQLLEVWCEKSTMNDVLLPACHRYGANLVTGLGELSVTAVNDLIERSVEADKPVRIFYISDFDPAGECMPVSVARKIEFLSVNSCLNFDIKLVSLMLTSQQCIEYELPRTPIKETELRREGFEERHGIGATELDAMEALHPGEMRRIVEDTLREHFDVVAWNEAVAKNKEIQEAVRSYLISKNIDEQLMADLDTDTLDDFEIPVGNEINDRDDQWLYDSEREYIDQLDFYREHREQRS